MGLWDEVNTSHHESEISPLVFSSACLFLVGFVCSDEGQIDVNCIQLSAWKSIYLYKEVKSNQGEIKLISLWPSFSVSPLISHAPWHLLHELSSLLGSFFLLLSAPFPLGGCFPHQDSIFFLIKVNKHSSLPANHNSHVNKAQWKSSSSGKHLLYLPSAPHVLHAAAALADPWLIQIQALEPFTTYNHSELPH